MHGVAMKLSLSEGRYYGASVLNLRASGLFLSECRCAPNTQVPEHSHRNPYFNITLEGSQVENFGEGTREYQPSVVAFHQDIQAPRRNDAIRISGDFATLGPGKRFHPIKARKR
jgi:hypothetical protein